MKKLYLIDGNSIFYRAFFALPHFHTKAGELTNAIYGFTATLLHFLLEHEPDYIGVVFDKGKKTFRHQEYKEYKATRPPAPDELYAQMPKTKEIVDAFHIPLFEEDNYEADDIIGALARKAEHEKNLHIYVISSDRDVLQLVSDKISVIMPKKGFSEFEEYTPESTKKHFGLTPEQIPDYKALAGDPSDNIKGIKGIGEQTAKKLLEEYGSLDNIYKNIDKIEGAVKTKLIENEEGAHFSKYLATLATNWPVKFSLDSCAVTNFDSAKVKELFEKLEFKSLLARFEKFKQKQQPSLF
ncbi:hypothetical protein HZA39_00120 [Candidatus Peregrinibacteria bacterium]|nr:hypothetical protein [Candidatus Peregrinibacteria bacterium]